MIHLFHIAVASDWEDARARGSYAISTAGATLEEVGFIHLSFRHQVRPSAERFYAGRHDLVLLEFDAAALRAPVRVETVPGQEHRFPHLYGPFTPREVLAVRGYVPGPDGHFPDPDPTPFSSHTPDPRARARRRCPPPSGAHTG